jgi:hypothetical protein
LAIDESVAFFNRRAGEQGSLEYSVFGSVKD